VETACGGKCFWFEIPW